MSKYILSFVSILMIGLLPLNASEIEQKNAEKIRWVEGYFNRLKTLKASFTQVNPDGSLSKGDFYLSRPGRMRIQYAHPDKRLMVADGDMFIYADPQNDEVSRIRLQVSPAFIILKEHVSFSKDNFRVIDFRDSGETVMLTVVNDDEPEYGNLTLTFDKKPFQLKQWDIVTQNGQHTTVLLSHIQKDVKLDARLFIYE